MRVPLGAPGECPQAWDWLQTLVAAVWADPQCGDGVCDAPQEMPGFGAHGCAADCGALPARTPAVRDP